MIPNFPTPFADELFHSWLARFQWLVEPHNSSRAMRFLFGKFNARVAVILPNKLGVFTEHLGNRAVTSATIIRKHTLVPIYAPFIPPERLAEVEENLERGDLALGLGAASNSVQNPEFLRYCPACTAEERSQFGEAYWHRSHQMAGVLVCPIHQAVLENSEARSRPILGLIAAEDAIPVLPLRNLMVDGGERTVILKIANDVQWLLENWVGGNSIASLHDRYFRLAAMRGYISRGGHILWKKVFPDLLNRYPGSVLESLQCAIPEKAFKFRPSWLSILLQGHPRAQHPIRHLVLMDFLGVSAKEFFDFNERNRVFDLNLRACRNPICPERGQPLIQVEYNCGPKRGVGSVLAQCPECGRKGSRYSKGGVEHEAVSEYGRLWDEELTRLWNDDSLSIVKIAKRLEVSTPTIKHQAVRLNLQFPRMTGRYKSVIPFKQVKVQRSERRERWIALRGINPLASRSELQSLDPTCYSWLYQNDRDWLRENLPARKKPPSPWQVKRLQNGK